MAGPGVRGWCHHQYGSEGFNERMDDRLVVAITGASGAIYGIRVLELLRELPVETHLVLSKWARVTIEQETSYALADVRALADVTWAENDQAAAISSGSFKTRGMIVVPCSTKTLAAIATGFSHNLVCRAADVTLKERRPLVLAVREAPLSSIHLRNMLALSDMGATILPPTPAFYTHPAGIDDIVEYTALRILDQLGLDVESPARWSGLRAPDED